MSDAQHAPNALFGLVWRWLLLIGALILMSCLFYAVLPVGVDFYYQFWPIPRAWLLEGTPVYSFAGTGFFNPPWAVLLLLPFSLLPIRWGMVVLTLFSVGVLLLALRTFARRKVQGALLLFLALCNLHTFDLLQRGQIDTFPLLGLTLAFLAVRHHRPWLLSVALVVVSTKPVNVALPLLVVLWPVRHWSARDHAKWLAIPVLTILASFPLFGRDWPARWWANYQALPPSEAWQSTLWRGLQVFNLSLWLGIAGILLASCFLVWEARRLTTSRSLVAVAQAVNLAITPYALASHYTLIQAVSLPEILARSRPLALALWALTFLPLLRLQMPPTYWWLDILFPLTAWAMLAAGNRRTELQKATPA